MQKVKEKEEKKEKEREREREREKFYSNSPVKNLCLSSRNKKKKLKKIFQIL